METNETPTYPEGRNLLKGKSVVITAAAGSGIGFATAKRCAEEGARVLLSDTHENRLAESVSLLQSRQFEAYGIPCDVTKENEVQELFNFAITKFETVDVMKVLADNQTSSIWQMRNGRKY